MFVKIEGYPVILASAFADFAAPAATAQVTTVTPTADVAGSLGGTMFTLHAANDAAKYGVWINVDAGNTQPPMDPSYTPVEVAISANDTAQTVSNAITAAIAALAEFGAANGGGTVVPVTITDTTNARARDAYDGNGAITEIGTNAGDVNNYATGFDVTVTTTGSIGTPTTTDKFVEVTGTYYQEEDLLSGKRILVKVSDTFIVPSHSVIRIWE